MFEVKIQKKFNARQGLKSPVRENKNLASLVPDDGFQVILTVGIVFEDVQLKPQGWYVDTDAVEEHVDKLAAHLQGDTWTSLFEFRPTFELVAKWSYEYLEHQIPQIDHVELYNGTLDVSTKYYSSNNI